MQSAKSHNLPLLSILPSVAADVLDGLARLARRPNWLVSGFAASDARPMLLVQSLCDCSDPNAVLMRLAPSPNFRSAAVTEAVLGPHNGPVAPAL